MYTALLLTCTYAPKKIILANVSAPNIKTNRERTKVKTILTPRSKNAIYSTKEEGSFREEAKTNF